MAGDISPFAWLPWLTMGAGGVGGGNEMPVQLSGPPDPNAVPAYPGTTVPGQNPMGMGGLSNPVMNLAMLRLGAELMQPVQPNQTTAGHIGKAIIGAGETYTTLAQQDLLNQLRTRSVAAQERDVGTRARVGEASAAHTDVQTMDLQQKMEFNQKQFPLLIKELNGKIDLMVSEGKLKEGQGEFWKQKAALYPQEVQADMIKANAAMKAAGRESGAEAIFRMTARAMKNSGEAESEDEAMSLLGQQWLGRGSKPSAGVQTLRELEDNWRRANPIGENEDPADYDQRAAASSLKLFREQKNKGYFEAKMDFLNKNGILFRNIDDAEQKFNEYWMGAGNELPDNAQQAEGDSLPTGKGGKVDANKLQDGKTYKISTPDYTGPAKWDSKTKKFIHLR